MRNMSRKGFTLIEIIIVIVILGVLATLALPKVTGQVEAARAGEAMAMLGTIKRAADQCYDNGGNLQGCDTFDALGITPPSGTLFSYYADADDTPAETDSLRVAAKRVGSGSAVDAIICMEFTPSSDSPVGFGYASFKGGNPYQGIVARTATATRTVATPCAEASYTTNPM